MGFEFTAAMKMDGEQVSSRTGEKAMNFLDVLKVFSEPNQIRGLVLASLFLQIILAHYGSKRQRSKSKILEFILWSAYLTADSVAIAALSLMTSHNFKPYEDRVTKLPDLVAFWSPLLLLHLGGPDAITALSLEDNKLWWRYFLALMVHADMAAFILFRSFFPHHHHHHHSSDPNLPPLLSLSILVFLAGFLKYLERTMALMSASFPQMRYSDTMFQDPSSHNYERKVAKYYPVSLPLDERRYKIIFEAHYLFPIFRRVFLNLSIDHESHNIGKFLFKDRDWKEVFKVIELELQIMFETLYTKALPNHATDRFILKIISFCCIFPVFIVFLCHYGRARYDQSIRTDIAITYILLGGAVVLEMYQGILMLLNDWTIMMIMKRKTRFGILHTLVLKYLPSSRLNLLYEPPRWSNSMGQCNLVSICIHTMDLKPQNMSTKFIRMKRLRWVRDMLGKFWRTVVTQKPIDGELKELILKHLWERVEIWEAEVGRAKSICVDVSRLGISEEDLFRSFLNRWGGWVLEKHNCQEIYGWTTSLEIGHSILLWHIATDICFYKYFDCSSTSTFSLHSRNQEATINCSLSKSLSDHLMYLLLKHSTIVTSKLIPDKQFNEVCEALRKVLTRDRRGIIRNESEACTTLYQNAINDHNDPLMEKIDSNELKQQQSSNMSGIEDACALAKSLMNEKPEKRWKIILGMWLEMLVYVANQCPGDRHAARLSQGGALITHVWLLMTHLGISTPCERAANVGTEKARLSFWSWYTTKRDFC